MHLTANPPFLKKLIDSKEINWKEYDLDLVTGGEGFAFGWRNEIEKNGRKLSNPYISGVRINLTCLLENKRDNAVWGE